MADDLFFDDKLQSQVNNKKNTKNYIHEPKTAFIDEARSDDVLIISSNGEKTFEKKRTSVMQNALFFENLS